jgi:hypothetical protein
MQLIFVGHFFSMMLLTCGGTPSLDGVAATVDKRTDVVAAPSTHRPKKLTPKKKTVV